jgi:hypothetical protein
MTNRSNNLPHLIKVLTGGAFFDIMNKYTSNASVLMQQVMWSKIRLIAGLVLVAGLGGAWAYQAWADGAIDYFSSPRSTVVFLQPGEIRELRVSVQNITPTTWAGETLRLGTIFATGDFDRPSVWSGSSDNRLTGWLSDHRITPSTTTSVLPLQRAQFAVTVQAPERSGAYREYFRPVLEGDRWLTGEVIAIDFYVGEVDRVAAQTAPAKAILINRLTQQGEMLEQGFVVATLPISTGRAGYTTPAGEYTIMNHHENAYSSGYDLWMPYWMAIVSAQRGYRGYGIHGLPYWRVNPARYEEGKIYPGGRLYTQGRLYEGYSHLGTPMSHGCIRFDVRHASILFNWAPNGTPVTII